MSESPNEPTGAAPAEAPQAAAEPSTPQPAAAVPSIVVEDPALAAASTTSDVALNARKDELPTNGVAAQPWAEAPFSSADADRFASGFRASWEVEEPAHGAGYGGAAGFSPRPRSATPSAGYPIHNEPVALPMQRTTRSPVFWGGIAVVVGVVGILIALVMSGSSSPEHPAVAQTGTAAAPVAPTTGSAPPATTPMPPVVAPVVAPVIPPVVAPPVIPPVVPPPVVAPVIPPVVAPVIPPVVAPVVPPPVVAAPTPPPPPTNHLRAHTSPESARLMVDGQSVANPYDGVLLRGHTYQLSAIADGYDPAMESVTLGHDQSVTLTLHRIPAPPPVAHHTAPPVHHPPAHHTAPPPHHTAPAHHTTHGHGSFVSDNPFD